MKTVPKSQAPAKEDAEWRQFPEIEKALFSEAPAPLLAKVEKTCRQLNEVIQGGSDADKGRATAAMTAYGRSLDLLRQLTEVRDKSADQK